MIFGDKHNQTIYNTAGNEKPEQEKIKSPFSDIIVKRFKIVKTIGHVKHCCHNFSCYFLCVSVVYSY